MSRAIRSVVTTVTELNAQKDKSVLPKTCYYDAEQVNLQIFVWLCVECGEKCEEKSVFLCL